MHALQIPNMLRKDKATAAIHVAASMPMAVGVASHNLQAVSVILIPTVAAIAVPFPVLRRPPV